jgi:hypothetical protein
LLVGTHSDHVLDSVGSFHRHFLVPDDDPRAISWRAHPGARSGGCSDPRPR